MEESLGKSLRRAREASGITVDDAVHRAKLPRAVVEALEADDFGFFTSPLYARSFLRQYGEYVHLDVTQWIDDLVPTALIDSEAVEAFIDLSDSEPMPSAWKIVKTKDSGGSAMAAVWMILITGGLILGGMEFYKTLDDKLSTPAPSPPQAATPVPLPPAAPEEKPVATTGLEPPKRAIIVHLPEE